jgi:hypothetical protein
MWKKYPERMYRARAVSFAIRDVFPDVVRGLLSVEEMMTGDEQDFPSEPGMAPEGYAAFVDSIVSAGEMGGRVASHGAHKLGTAEQRTWLRTDKAAIDRIVESNKTPATPPDTAPVTDRDLVELGEEVFSRKAPKKKRLKKTVVKDV